MTDRTKCKLFLIACRGQRRSRDGGNRGRIGRQPPGRDLDRARGHGRLENRLPRRAPQNHRQRPSPSFRHRLGQQPSPIRSGGPKAPCPAHPRAFRYPNTRPAFAILRKIITAPNGDIFLAESMPGRIKLLRDADGDGKAETTGDFATGLNRPFGIAFYPPGPNPTHVYVGNTDSVVRFPYQNGDTKARGPAETIVKNIPSGREQVGGGGHWTRDVQFSRRR